MATNGVKTSDDVDMAECDGEKVVTMMDVLKEQQEFEDDANAVLGASDDKNCTYSRGYVKRQALYACLTCCPDASTDPSKRAGVCLACSLSCHENHDLVELYTKRNFRCDCGNPKFTQPCQFTPNKSDLNYDNKYNQNFSGLYCTCKRPYPDPEAHEEEEMLQCIVCEDWLHTNHLDATVPNNDQYAEMICKDCMDDYGFLHDYSDLVVNTVDKEIIVMDPDLDFDMTVTKKATPTKAARKEIIPNGTIDDKSDKETHSILDLSINSIVTENKMDEESTKVEKEEKIIKEGEDNENSTQETVNDGPNEDNKEATDSTVIEPKVDHKEEATDDPKVEDKDDHKVESNDNPKVEANDDHKVESNDNHNIETNDVLKVETNNDHKFETNDDHKVETSKDHKVETSDDHKVETNDHKVETNDHKDETNERQKVEPYNESLNKEVDESIKENADVEKPDQEMETRDDKENTEPGATNNEATSEEASTSVPKDEKLAPTEDNQNPEVDEKKGADESDKESETQSKLENKRKHSESEDLEDSSPKKAKIVEPCLRPKVVKRFYNGATFWPSNFRQKLCSCGECISMYKDLAVLYLIDPDDTVNAYEALGKDNADGPSSQYEKGLQALQSLDRVQQINALTEYNKMRDKLLDFLKSFKDRKEIVKEEDIKAFFAGMKPKREPDGVYFCR